jgi:hypothetical protein
MTSKILICVLLAAGVIVASLGIYRNNRAPDEWISKLTIVDVRANSFFTGEPGSIPVELDGENIRFPSDWTIEQAQEYRDLRYGLRHS